MSRLLDRGKADHGTFGDHRPTALAIPPACTNVSTFTKAIPWMIVDITQVSTILLVALFGFGIPFAGSLPTLYLRAELPPRGGHRLRALAAVPSLLPRELASRSGGDYCRSAGPFCDLEEQAIHSSAGCSHWNN